jgi:hypothetical protein
MTLHLRGGRLELEGPPCLRGGRLQPALWTIAALLTLTLLGACGPAVVPAPRAIVLGSDTCVQCRQTIATLDAAAQAVFADGTTRVYDDLGCLATDRATLRRGGQLYVQFAGGKGWARVEDVHFASPKDRQSPRRYNYFAYTQDEAQRIDAAGWARGWGDLVAELNRGK